MGKFQNILNKEMGKGWMLRYFKIVNTKVAAFIKWQSHRGSNHLLSVKSIKIEKVRGGCHIKLI